MTTAKEAGFGESPERRKVREHEDLEAAQEEVVQAIIRDPQFEKAKTLRAFISIAKSIRASSEMPMYTDAHAQAKEVLINDMRNLILGKVRPDELPYELRQFARYLENKNG